MYAQQAGGIGLHGRELIVVQCSHNAEMLSSGMDVGAAISLLTSADHSSSVETYLG